jgi:hypothetical protein
MAMELLPPPIMEVALKKLFLLMSLVFLAVPYAASGSNNNNNNNNNNQPKPRGSAPEMPGFALAAAGIVGLSGYLLIRRRHSVQN